MTTLTIDPDNNITAFAHRQEAEEAASGQSFATQDALGTLTASWPMNRFVTVWNSFAGVAGFGADLKPVKKFENRDKAIARIWKALHRLWRREVRVIQNIEKLCPELLLQRRLRVDGRNRE